MRHRAVAHVAVIGMPYDEKAERVCAAVLPASPVDAGDLVVRSREQLGRHKYPRRAEVGEVLPTAPSREVLERELRTRFG
jgi:long-chain acyl-CoA synthetase